MMFALVVQCLNAALTAGVQIDGLIDFTPHQDQMF